MLAKQNLEEETRNLHHIAPVMMLPELPSRPDRLPLHFGEMSRNQIIIKTTLARSLVMVVGLGFKEVQ
jgi:hypothetical protein